MNIVVTGSSLLTTLGVGPREVFRKMLEGSCETHDSVPGFDAKEHLGKRGLRHFDRTALLVASASKIAMQQCDLSAETYGKEKLGVVLGSTHGSIQAIAEFDQEAVREGPKYVNPQQFPNTVISAPAGRTAVLLQALGLNTTIATGTTSALEAAEYSATVLKNQIVDAVICMAGLGESKEIEEGYIKAGRLAASNGTSVPFAKDRSGAALSEGAAAFCLEPEAHAQARNVEALARISGSGSAFTLADDGLQTAIQFSMQDAGLKANEISCVVSSASGHPSQDLEEGLAIAKVLGSVPVTAPKSYTGDCLEASGAIGMALALQILEQQVIPPVAHLDEMDPALQDLHAVKGDPLRCTVEHVLLTARDPEGHCSALILSKPE